MTEPELMRIRNETELAAVGHMTASSEGQLALKMRQVVEEAMRMREALLAVRAHHRKLNGRQGRPWASSHTLDLVRVGLGEGQP